MYLYSTYLSPAWRQKVILKEGYFLIKLFRQKHNLPELGKMEVREVRVAKVMELY